MREPAALLSTFGRGGHIDLKENLGVDPARVFIEMTSPGAIYKNFLILGSRVNESYDASPGHIRAYDTVTGALRWIFHTIPQPGEFGHDTWQWVEGENYGGANAWGGVTIDEQRGWAFVATGSPTEDFYGAFRKGNNLFGNCVIALDATTGERQWHYQTVHHDIWDYDNPPAPILATLNSGGTSRDVVVQLTKMGFTFVLDRDSGSPVFPVVEMPVPASDVPGEEASPTQPVPLKPAPLVRQRLTEAEITNISPEARAFTLQEFRKYKSGPLYTPLTLQGTISMPGHLGGSEWHGGSFDPTLNVLYVNSNELPTLNRLRAIHDPILSDGTKLTLAQHGRLIYESACISCHGAERQGAPPLIPALTNVQKPDAEMRAIILQGRNSMPAFNRLRPAELDGLLAFLRSSPGEVANLPASSAIARYTLDGYPLFLDQDGFPGISPPWGTLSAVDLVSGDIRWKVPLGEYPELVARGIRHTGTPNYGGAVATAGGSDLHRRHRGRENPRFRKTHGPRALGISTARGRLRDAKCVHDRWPAVRGDHRGRRRQKWHKVRRLDRRVFIAGFAGRAGVGCGGRGVDRTFRRRYLERLGPFERRPHHHGGRGRHRRSDRRGERPHEFVSLHDARVRRL